jgi:hypothetical protein
VRARVVLRDGLIDPADVREPRHSRRSLTVNA